MTRSRPGALRRAQIHAALLAHQAWSQRAKALLAADDLAGAAAARDHAQVAADEHQLLINPSRTIHVEQLPLF